MRSERRLEGTRGNTKAGQKKRSETKYGCGGDGEPVSRFGIVFLFSVLNTRNRTQAKVPFQNF